MARWKLMAPHYLNVDDTEWEYQENDRKTGRAIRKRFLVPRFLHPLDPGDWTNRWGAKDDQEGEIIVCHEGKGQASDIVFHGDPTPDMMPVDDEAKEISAGFAEQWSYKPDGGEISYSQSLIDQWQADMADLKTKPVQIEGLNELVGVMAAMQKQNSELISAIAEGFKRRV